MVWRIWMASIPVLLLCASASSELQNVVTTSGIRIRTNADAPAAGPGFFQTDFLLGAHRGGAGLWPENTVVAYTKAVEAWPNIVLEADANLTKDGHVVVLHDSKVDRTTNGTGNVTDLTLDEVKQLDAGYDFTQDGGMTYPYRGEGLTIPTLAEALAATPDSRWIIEFKNTPGVVDATIAVVKQANALDRVIFASFNAAFVKRARELAPGALFCYDFESGAAMLLRLRGDSWDSYEPAAAMLSLDKRMIERFQLTRDDLEKIRGKGVRLQIHTPNTKEAMLEAIELGADSILTDRPDILDAIMTERAAASTR